MINEENVIRKGVDKSLYLFKKLYKLYNEFRMVIIGPLGQGSELIQKIIIKEHLKEFVTLTGTISEHDKIGILKSSSVYTHYMTDKAFNL